MTLQEWLLDSLSIYHPACSNLYNPTRNLMNNMLEFREQIISDAAEDFPKPIAILMGYFFAPILTDGLFSIWQGRIILFGDLLILLGAVIFILWAFYKIITWPFRIFSRLVSWILRKVRSRKEATV